MGDENKGAAGAATAEPAKAEMVYLKLVGDDHYKGQDPVTGTFHHLIRGDVAEFSAVKAAQVQRDFPKLFKGSTAAEYDKAREDRERRSRELADELKRKEKAQAAQERARATNDDDDD